MVRRRALARKAYKRTTWELERLLPICQSLARWLAPRFRGLPAFDEEDLVAEGLRISLVEHKKFKGRNYCSWMQRRIRSRLIDLLRSAAADRSRCEAAARPEAYVDVELLKAQYGLTRRVRRRRKKGIVMVDITLSQGELTKLGAALRFELASGADPATQKRTDFHVFIGTCRAAFVARKAYSDVVTKSLETGLIIHLAKVNPGGKMEPDLGNFRDKFLPEIMGAIEACGAAAEITRAAP